MTVTVLKTPEMILSFKYRLLPTKRQHRALERILEDQRQLYNAALEERISCYQKTGKGRAYIDWMIVGGESGKEARPMHPAWARSIRDQCADAGVPFFFKQWGEHLGGTASDSGDAVWFESASGEADSDWLEKSDNFGWFDPAQEGPDGPMHLRVGKKRAGRLLDGIEHNAFPTRQP